MFAIEAIASVRFVVDGEHVVICTLSAIACLLNFYLCLESARQAFQQPLHHWCQPLPVRVIVKFHTIFGVVSTPKRRRLKLRKIQPDAGVEIVEVAQKLPQVISREIEDLGVAFGSGINYPIFPESL